MVAAFLRRSMYGKSSRSGVPVGVTARLRVVRAGGGGAGEQRTAFVVLGLGSLVWKRGRQWVGDLTSHGTAKLGDMATLMQNDMAGDGDGDCLIFGRAGLAMSPDRVQGGLP